MLNFYAAPFVDEFRGHAEIEVIEATFETAIEMARERERSIDAFISAGANAALLRSALDTPVATIKPDGYDVLVALIKARNLSRQVGIISYRSTVPQLEMARDLLDIDIEQRAYTTPTQARDSVDELLQLGIRVLIGSSFVIELAERHGGPWHFVLLASIYTPGLRRRPRDGARIAS